jgi:hypothetical protein
MMIQRGKLKKLREKPAPINYKSHMKPPRIESRDPHISGNVKGERIFLNVISQINFNGVFSWK